MAAGAVLNASVAATTCLAHRAEAEANGIRDTEIENDIRTLARPIWRIAGLDPNDVGVYLIQDTRLNSFVAGGQAIFINTGLILRAETPGKYTALPAQGFLMYEPSVNGRSSGATLTVRDRGQ